MFCNISCYITIDIEQTTLKRLLDNLTRILIDCIVVLLCPFSSYDMVVFKTHCF